MKFSGIGGQAVMEGIMMRNGSRYAVAVRKPDGSIEVKADEYAGFSDRHKWAKWPFIRGVVSFIDSMKLGFKTLLMSANMSGEEDEQLSKGETVISMVLAVVVAIGVFMLLPTVLINLLRPLIASEILLAALEGILRLFLFISYILIISRMKEIKRTFMYHGSEHKCINCVEHGMPLTVENVMKSSKEHKRCGTSFLLIIMLLSIVLFMFIKTDTLWLRLLSRLLLIPVIASVSYEILRFTGKYDNRFTYIISRPGIWLQGLTTKEPTDDMAEVAIQAVSAVFDWEGFLAENFPE